jgi:MSHA biogenesis protein MshG
MPMYAYRGRNAVGQMVTGRLEANDKGSIADQLFGAGIVPIEISLAVDDATVSLKTMFVQSRQKVSTIEMVLLFRQLYTLSKAGVPILRALAGLQESAANPALAKIIDDMRVSLDSGRELSSAMRRHPHVFTQFHVAMVQVGEMTGRLEEIFLRISEHLDFEDQMHGKVKSALRYPTFVIIAMVAAITIANVFIIPQFTKMFESLGTDLPFLTQLLVGMSDFTVHYWWTFIVAIIGGQYSFKAWVATDEGRLAWDRIKMGLPIAGKIITKATLARFARSLALSIKSGVPLVQALNSVAAVVDNRYVESKIRQMSLGVQRGDSVLATAAQSKIFSPITLQMIAIGDETGELDDLMLEIATMYEREVEYDVKGLSAQIEPILIVFLAAFVLILALGILTPMWGMHKAMLTK